MNRLLNCNILETQYICISDTAPTDIAAAMKIQLFANGKMTEVKVLRSLENHNNLNTPL
jgi:hypothetical protein